MSLRGLPIVCLALLPLGCSAGTATLTGTVSYQGKLLNQGTVSVYADSGESSSAEIQPDGSYKIENCPRGKLKICVASVDPVQVAATIAATKATGRFAQGAPEPAPPPGDPAKWFSIPAQYADPDGSGLSVDVSAGENEYNINLP